MEGLRGTLRQIAVGLVVAVAGAWLVHRYIVRHDEAPAATAAPTAVPIDFDLPGYFARLDALSGDFAEREEFIRSIKGRPVRWQGFVVDASTGGSEGVILVIGTIQKYGRDFLVVDYPVSFATRILSRHPGDLVLITGKFSPTPAGTAAVDGESFELITPASAQPDRRSR
jgi:hypothetical protein